MIFPKPTLALTALLGLTTAQSYTGPEDPRVKVALTLETPSTGVSTTPDGRLFLIMSRIDGTTGPQVVEYDRATNTSKAYPNEEWNSYAEGKDPATHLVRINSQRFGPDGNLWYVDTGSPAFGEPVIFPDGPKLVVINVTTNEVQRVYPMGNVSRSVSLLDDVRFNPASGKAYITDAGAPALIVLDLATGDARRVLEDDISAREYMPISAEGQIVRANGKPFYVYADHLEVSPDAKYFYFQPASGGMSRIETKMLDMAFYNSSLNANSVLGQYVEPYAHTPSTGGTAIDAEGNIYDSDTDSQRIIKISPNGTMTTLVQDPRLLWVDAMWIDCEGKLWMPVAQLNRGTPFNDGKNLLVRPINVYTIDIGVGPPAIDHA